MLRQSAFLGRKGHSRRGASKCKGLAARGSMLGGEKAVRVGEMSLRGGQDAGASGGWG